jgi:hypothetical protein
MKRCFLIVVALLSIAELCSAQYNFTSVDYPGAAATRLVGLNDHFDIVGNYTLPGGVRHAMLFSKGQFTALDPDGILGTHTSAANQISNRGHISGWYIDEAGRHGYVLRDGVIETINYPGADFTQVNGVTDNDTVIGHFRGSDGNFHGFVLKEGTFTQIDFPGATDTFPFYMNARGDIAGEWDPSITVAGHGFLFTKHGEWISFDAPGAPENSTLAIGVNDHEEVLGEFFQADGLPRIFIVNGRHLDSPDAFHFIEAPWPASFPETMNNRGAFVGIYSDAVGGIHGFIAVPDCDRK